MYCTCAPCGDASMELCMAAQEDATPWDVTPPKPDPNASNSEDDDPSTNLLDGRAHFSILGVVRRKPARMDAESTRSKSCSDKLALRQVSSLLSHETSLLVAPTRNAYLEGVILPEEEISRVGCERSFSETGRMKALNGRLWPENEDKHSYGYGYGYRFQPFKILPVPTEQIESLWPFAKPKPTTLTQETHKKSKPGNVSAIWTIAPSVPSHPTPPTLDNGSKSLPVLRGSKTGLYETIINGVKQGNRASSPLARGASALSRAKLWSLLRGVLQAPGFHSGQVEPRLRDPGVDELHSVADIEDPLLHADDLRRVLEASTYQELKRALLSSKPTNARDKAMQDAKRVLKGWIPNSGDENWGLDVLVDPKKRKR
ncbi:hypothetical protein MW887_010466 [Aspergillus wentii]|nr:hypothetical protein MW887_010466 [Aspergillus wentii]